MISQTIIAVALLAQVRSGGGVVRSTPPVSPDIAARREVIRNAGKNPDNPDLLPLIEKSMQDSDTEVRFLAMSALSQVIMKTAVVTSQGGSLNNDPRGRPTLQPALVRALDDSDPRIRGAAVQSLGIIANPRDRGVKTALMAAYQREHEASVRAAIINYLGTRSFESSDVQQFVMNAINDVSPRVRRPAALAVAKLHPPDALPRIVAELQSGNVETRSEFVHALASYGVLAKPYVNVLEVLLGTETRRSYQEQIRNAITAIQNSK